MKRRTLPALARPLILIGHLLLLLLSLPRPAAAAALLDGFVINSSGSVEIGGQGILAAALQPWNGKIVIGGDFTITGGTPSHTWTNLARINPDGTLDTSFQPPNPDRAVRALAIQPDQGTPANPELSLILAGGSFGQCGATARNGLARFASADGALDTDFHPVTSPAPVRVNAIALQPDGTSMLAGGSFAEIAAGTPSENLARISLAVTDPGAAGWSYGTGINGEVNAILPLGGPFLIAGSFQAPGMLLARFTANGTPDATFQGGFVTAPPGGKILALARQTDGKILIGGDFEALRGGVPTRTYLARLNRDGSPDASFTPGGDGSVGAITVQPDGRILTGGAFTVLGAPPAARQRLARLNLSGALDAAFVAGLDAVVHALVLQPDGKILVGGEFASAAGAPRTRLARLYGQGALDDDVSAANLAPDQFVTSVAQQPKGVTTIGGNFTRVQGKSRNYVARLTEQWNVADDLSFNPAPLLDAQASVLAPLGDDGLLVGGGFSQPQHLVLRLDVDGYRNGTAEITGYNGNLDSYLLWSTALSLVPLRSGTLLPNGTELPRGMAYAGGDFFTSPDPYKSLFRISSNGLRDPSFAPAGVTWLVYGLAIQPDNKLLVAGIDPWAWPVTAKLQRLKTNGELDFDFTPVPWEGGFFSVVAQPDGQVVAAGSIANPITIGGTTWNRNIVRFKNSGAIDDTFNVEAFYESGGYTNMIFGVVPQTEGGMLIFGLFNRVRDATGTVYQRDCVARIKPDGKLDQDFDVGPFDYNFGTPENNVGTVVLQQDGKVILGGDFLGVNGSAVRKLARFYNGRAGEELSVSADGSSITWLRSGAGPELWQAYFEYSDDPDAPVWTPLGNAQRTAGGWRLDGLTLKDFGYRVNRYVRARGYAAGNRGGAGSMLESVRLYYLEPPKTVVTVTALPREKTYGDPDPAPLTYSYAPQLANGDSFSGTLLRTAGEGVGDHAINQGSLSLSEEYILNFTGALLKIKPKLLVVTADDQTRGAGLPNPPLTASYTGLASRDTPASLAGAPELTTTANLTSRNGSYPIHVAAGSLFSTNYDFDFVDGELLVTGLLPQSIGFPPLRPKTFGDGDFDPGASASSGLAVGYASSAGGVAAVAAVAGDRLRVVAPGTAEITASQGGDDSYAAAPSVTRTLLVNPPPWNGLGFDGVDDLLRLADAPQLNFGAKAGFTIESWLRLDGTQPDGTGLLSKGEAASPWSGYQLILQQDRVAAEIGAGGSSVGAAEGLVGTTSLNDGRWHHVALAVDRLQGRGTLYLDGRVEATLSHPAFAASPNNTEPLRAGTDRSAALFFKGELDEARLWDVARTREEIRASQSQILDPLDQPRLMAYFHLDEGDAGQNNALFPKAPERTAHAADGTLQGFALSGASSNWIRSGAFLPLLETGTVASVSGNSATAGILVYPNYYPAADVGLCWNSSPGPTLADSCSHSGSGTGPFAGVISGLTPGVTYYVRAFAVNVMGTAWGNEVSFLAGRQAQTIDMGDIGDRTYGDASFTPGGSATSGLPVTYTSSSPKVAIVANGEIRITGAGSTTITASQGGNEVYSPAPDVFVPFTVLKAPLSVVAEDKTRAYLTPNPELTAIYRGFVYGEGGSVLTGAPVLGTTATLSSAVGSYPVAVGPGTLEARNYTLIPVPGTLYVFKSCQEISFPALPERTFGDPPFEIVASACSGLALHFSSSDPSVARVSGNQITMTGAGSAVITAVQQGSGNLETAPSKSQTLIVQKSGQGVSFSSLAQKVVGDPPFTLEGSASSGLPVSYLSSDPGVAAVSGNLVTIVGAGTTVISAQQTGDNNYLAAPPVSQPLTVAREGNPPQLALSTLSSGASTSNPVLNVVGAASDPSGIASLTVNGADLTGEAALFSSAVALADGVNTIGVAARDGAGNRTTQSLAVTLDALAPFLGVAAPADNSVTDTSACSVSGTVTPGSSVTMAVNGEAPQLLQVSEGSFSGTGYLAEGVNTLELDAALSGRSSRVKRSVTLAPGKPAVSITEPAQDVRTEQQLVTVRGCSGTLLAGSVLLQVGDALYTPELSAGAFEQQVPLAGTGEIRISARATAADGETSVARRNIVRIERIAGDLDGNGSVDIQDASRLLRISLGSEPVTAQALLHGDVAPLVKGVPQPDGIIDVGDLLVLLRRTVGLVQF